MDKCKVYKGPGVTVESVAQECLAKGIGYFAMSKKLPLTFTVPSPQEFKTLELESLQQVPPPIPSPKVTNTNKNRKNTVAERLAEGMPKSHKNAKVKPIAIRPIASGTKKDLQPVSKKAVIREFTKMTEMSGSRFASLPVVCDLSSGCFYIDRFVNNADEIEAPLYRKASHISIDDAIEDVFGFEFYNHGRISCPLLNTEVLVMDKKENVKMALKVIQWLSQQIYVYFDMEGIYRRADLKAPRAVTVLQAGAYDYRRDVFVAYIFCFPILRYAEVRSAIKSLFERERGFMVGFDLHPNKCDGVMMKDLDVDIFRVRCIDAQAMFKENHEGKPPTMSLDKAWMSQDPRILCNLLEVDAALERLSAETLSLWVNTTQEEKDLPEIHPTSQPLYLDKKFRMIQYIVLDVIKTYVVALLSRSGNKLTFC